MIIKQLRAMAAALLAVALAMPVGAATVKKGDFASGAFKVTAGNSSHTYSLEQLVKSGAVSGFPKYTAATTGTDLLLDFAMGDQQRPYVMVEIYDFDTTAGSAPGGFAANEKGLVRFTLSGAKFASGVANADFKALEGGASVAASTALRARIVKGGGVGDSFVEFEVEALAAFDTAMTQGTNTAGDAMVLILPSLKEVGVGGVSVSVTTDLITSNFPVLSTVKVYAEAGDTTSATPPEQTDGAAKATVVGAAADAVKVSVTKGMDVDIDLEGRMMLVNADDSMTSLIKVADVAVTLTAGVLQSDGKALSFTGDAAGHLVLKVSGLHATDTVFLNTQANKPSPKADVGETLSMANGMASGQFVLSSLSPASLYVMTDGKRTLSPGTLKVEGSVVFNNGMANLRWLPASPWVGVEPVQKGSVDLQYKGTTGTLPRAFGIAPAGSGTGDISNVRITCNGSSDCEVYLACNDAAGMDVFGKVGMVAARSTTVLRDGGGGTAMDLRDVFPEGSWTSGRLGCRVISPGSKVEVQVLTRAGNVLVNNTYVDASE